LKAIDADPKNGQRERIWRRACFTMGMPTARFSNCKILSYDPKDANPVQPGMIRLQAKTIPAVRSARGSTVESEPHLPEDKKAAVEKLTTGAPAQDFQ
jgi:hypothetical protein